MADLRSQVCFVLLDRRGRAGGCSVPLAVRQRPLDVKASPLDLPAVEPAGPAAQGIPLDKLGLERIGPP